MIAAAENNNQSARFPADAPCAPDCDRHCPRRTCPLSLVKAGAAVRIHKLSTAPEIAQRLREIGFGERQVIRLVVRQANLICQVCNTRLALSAELAGMIIVEPIAVN